MKIEVRLPPLGDSVTEATMVDWLKAVGDAVEADDVVAEVMTDKANFEIVAPVAGVLAEQLAKAGDVVEPESVIGSIERSA